MLEMYWDAFVKQRDVISEADGAWYQGEEVKLKKADKAIYSYMARKYDSYKKSHLDYYESAESIGKHTDYGRTTVVASIKTLCKAGLLEVHPFRKGTVTLNRYTILTPSPDGCRLFRGEDKEEIVVLYGKRDSKKNTQPQPAVYSKAYSHKPAKPVYASEDPDEDVPF